MRYNQLVAQAQILATSGGGHSGPTRSCSRGKAALALAPDLMKWSRLFTACELELDYRLTVRVLVLTTSDVQRIRSRQLPNMQH